MINDEHCKLDADDVTVEDIELPQCDDCDNRATKTVRLDLRNNGMSIVAGCYCDGCVGDVVKRLRGSLSAVEESVEPYSEVMGEMQRQLYAAHEARWAADRRLAEMDELRELVANFIESAFRMSTRWADAGAMKEPTR